MKHCWIWLLKIFNFLVKVTYYKFPQGTYNFLHLWNGLDYGSIFLKKHLARKHRLRCWEAKGDDVFKGPITVPGTEQVLTEGGGGCGDSNGGILAAITGQRKAYILWWLAHTWNTYKMFLKTVEAREGETSRFWVSQCSEHQTHCHITISNILCGKFIISVL